MSSDQKSGSAQHLFGLRPRKASLEARTGVLRRGDTFWLTPEHRTLRIRFRGPAPTGWINIRYRAEMEGVKTIGPYLLVESADGTTERIQLKMSRNGASRDVVLLPSDAEALWFGVERSGTLTLKNLRIAELGELWLAGVTGSMAARAAIRNPRAARYEADRILLDGNDLQTAKHAALEVARGQLDRSYERWIADHDTLTVADEDHLRADAESWDSPPLIALVVDARSPDTTAEMLGRTLHSIITQLSPHWVAPVLIGGAVPGVAGEVHRALMASTGRGHAINPMVMTAAEFQRSGLEADVSHVTSIVAGDLLARQAVHRVGALLRRYPETVLAYTDEDRIDASGNRSNPECKPTWDPDFLTGRAYTTRLGVWRSDQFPDGTSVIDVDQQLLHRIALDAVAGGELDRSDRDGAVRHLPEILYHRSVDHASTSPPPDGIPELASLSPISPASEPEGGWPRLSAIVCTRDQPQHLRTCLAGLLDDTDYPDLEVVIVDNGTVDPDALDELDRRGRDSRVRVVVHDAPFNFSELNNIGVSHSTGSVVALLNNDIEVIEPLWLKAMVHQAVRADVGAVGCRLDYPDGTLQHAAVVVGMGGIAGHVNKHAAPGEDHHGRTTFRREVGAVTAAAMLLRRDVFDQVDGLDATNLAVAFNDIDLCLRIAELGLAILYEPAARLIHHESVSRGPDTNPIAAKRFASEIAYMRKRWADTLNAEDPFHSPNLAIDREDGTLAFPRRAPTDRNVGPQR